MTPSGAKFGKRSMIWLVEIVSEALLLGAALAALLGYDKHEYLKDTFVYATGISMMFFLTGYLLTTLLSRVFWKLEQWWFYPLIAAALFLTHFQIMNVGVGGAFDLRDRGRILAVGIGITLLCTAGGGLILRRWVRS